MLLETSAIVCSILGEAGSERLHELLNQARIVAVATPSLLEAGLVLTGRGVDARVVPSRVSRCASGGTDSIS